MVVSASKAALIAWTFDPGQGPQDAEHSELVSTLRDDVFWRDLDLFIKVQRPIRTVIKVLEADGTRLSDVYGSFLHLQYVLKDYDFATACLQRRIEFTFSNLYELAFRLDQRYFKWWAAVPLRKAIDHLVDVVHLAPGFSEETKDLDNEEGAACTVTCGQRCLILRFV